MYGAAVVGKEKAEELRRKRIDGAGTGAIQFGVRVTGAKEVPIPTPKRETPKGGRRFSEERAIETLKHDPHAWDIVLEAETRRAEFQTEGARKRVAVALLEAAELAKAKPMPGPVMEQLRVMAK